MLEPARSFLVKLDLGSAVVSWGCGFLGAHWESDDKGQNPGATGAAWDHGSLQAMEWVRSLGSWEPSWNLKLWKIPGAMGDPVATGLRGAAGAHGPGSCSQRPSASLGPVKLPEATGAGRFPG